MTSPILGIGEHGEVGIDVPRLIASRALLCAQSGRGKSWALRRILEQTHGHVQQLVIDPEGEYYTLREGFDYVLAGRRGGDCAAEPRSAALLARRLLELGTSAILDISELGQRDREAFVANFVTALIRAPRELWHPVLVPIDEAHQFAPEQGRRAGPRGPSADAVVDLMALGRKRGFAPLIATQRISKLSKDVVAEAGNIFAGGCTLPADVATMAKFLGLAKDQIEHVKKLKPGQFYVFGPAISEEVQLVEVGNVETTHPRPGKVAPPPAPAPEAVQAVLGELADIAIEAEAEEDEKEALRAQMRALQRDLKVARSDTPPASTEELERAREEGRRESAAGLRDAERRLTEVVALVDRRTGRQVRLLEQAQKALHELEDAQREPLDVPMEAMLSPAKAPRHMALRTAPLEPYPPKREAPAAPPRGAREAGAGACDLPRGECAVLTAIAQHCDGVSREQLSVLTGYKRSSRDTYLQKLGAAGMIETRGGAIHATQFGVEALGPDFEPLPTGDALREHWLERLPEGERIVLEVLITAYPKAVERSYIDDVTGYKRSSRDTYVQKLTARKLAESIGRGQVRAADVLFQER